MKWVCLLVLAMPVACSFNVDEFTTPEGDAQTDTSTSQADAISATDSTSTDSTSTIDTSTLLDDTGPVDDAKMCPPSTPNICSGMCTDVNKDPKNCGKCGNSCNPSETCNAMKCQKKGAGG
ncbi:MAG: hypothetical protein ACXWUG_24095 [Polyangiales bacterium]